MYLIKELLSKIYKALKHLNTHTHTDTHTHTHTHPVKKQAKDISRYFLKKTYKWPSGIL